MEAAAQPRGPIPVEEAYRQLLLSKVGWVLGASKIIELSDGPRRTNVSLFKTFKDAKDDNGWCLCVMINGELVFETTGEGKDAIGEAMGFVWTEVPPGTVLMQSTP
jgi:hypothetical protein